MGTIAAGVAKAHADIILISGHEGGTGAAAFSSIKNTGSAWELGLSEVHQVLMLNGLRNRVTLRTDGGMRTGMDIIFGALLGAEEFNFGTAALDRQRVRVRAPVPPEHLPGGRGDTGRKAARQVQGQAREHRQLLQRRGGRGARDHGPPRRADDERTHRPRRTAAPETAQGHGPSQGQHARPAPDARRREQGRPDGAAFPHARPQRRVQRPSAGRRDPPGRQRGHQPRQAARALLQGPQHEPLGLHEGQRRDRLSARRGGAAGESAGDHPARQRGPEPRGVPEPGPAGDPRRRGERLRRQGHERWVDHAPAAARARVRGARGDDRGQHMSCTARRAGISLPTAGRGNVSRCATPGRRRWSRVWATTVAST